MRFIFVALALSLCPSAALAQGSVQEDPRRPPPPQDTPGCEIWQGTIVGNDPSAIAYFQLCGREDIRGIFLFTSLQSGWSRHRIAGQWSEQHTVISLRDLAMEESHPRNGWTLCAAETYNLRVTRPGHINGTFDSAQCRDHGEITLDLTHVQVWPPVPRLPPPPPASSRPGDVRRFRKGFHCSVSQGTLSLCERSPGRLGALLAGLILVATQGKSSSKRRQNQCSG